MYESNSRSVNLEQLDDGLDIVGASAHQHLFDRILLVHLVALRTEIACHVACTWTETRAHAAFVHDACKLQAAAPSAECRSHARIVSLLESPPTPKPRSSCTRPRLRASAPKILPTGRSTSPAPRGANERIRDASPSDVLKMQYPEICKMGMHQNYMRPPHRLLMHAANAVLLHAVL